MSTLSVEAVAQHHHPCRIVHTGLDSSAAVYPADLLTHDSKHTRMMRLGVS